VTEKKIASFALAEDLADLPGVSESGSVREHIDLNKRPATTTPVKASTPTKPVGRTSKAIKINLDAD
jgi:hypothetical protein